MNHQNSIVIRPYHGNKYENNLAKLKTYLLKHILECNNVREVVKRDFLNTLKVEKSVKKHKKRKLSNRNNIHGLAQQQVMFHSE